MQLWANIFFFFFSQYFPPSPARAKRHPVLEIFHSFTHLGSSWGCLGLPLWWLVHPSSVDWLWGLTHRNYTGYEQCCGGGYGLMLTTRGSLMCAEISVANALASTAIVSATLQPPRLPTQSRPDKYQHAPGCSSRVCTWVRMKRVLFWTVTSVVAPAWPHWTYFGIQDSHCRKRPPLHPYNAGW